MNKPERERQILFGITYMRNLKKREREFIETEESNGGCQDLREREVSLCQSKPRIFQINSEDLIYMMVLIIIQYCVLKIF